MLPESGKNFVLLFFLKKSFPLTMGLVLEKLKIMKQYTTQIVVSLFSSLQHTF